MFTREMTVSELRRNIDHVSQLKVYNFGMAAAGRIFELSKSFPTEERYSLTDQMRRSSRSVCANLAEAWGKRIYRAAFQCKLKDAESEALEIQTWIVFAEHCGYIDQPTAKELHDSYRQVIGMLVSMRTHPEKWSIK